MTMLAAAMAAMAAEVVLPRRKRSCVQFGDTLFAMCRNSLTVKGVLDGREVRCDGNESYQEGEEEELGQDIADETERSDSLSIRNLGELAFETQSRPFSPQRSCSWP
jgi:hypothetical protein